MIQGANMQFLGRREPHLYGSTTAKELDAILRRKARDLGMTLDIRYTNLEGVAITWIYEAVDSHCSGVLMNPAGFSHAGYALRDCLRAVPLPYVEVHMTNIDARGFHSVTAPSAQGIVAGFGVQSYVLGLEALHGIIAGSARKAAPVRAARAAPARAAKARRAKVPARRRRG
jgi:3-dehydroquinate dehydratase-2